MVALYRFFDASDRLLYVGISVNPPSRWRQHELEKPWWAEVARVTVEHHETGASATDAELEAIEAEAPVYNRRSVRMPNAPAERVESSRKERFILGPGHVLVVPRERDARTEKNLQLRLHHFGLL